MHQGAVPPEAGFQARLIIPSLIPPTAGQSHRWPDGDALAVYGLWGALKNVQFCSRSRKTIIFSTGTHLVFGGLKFELDVEIGQKGHFFKALL
ncbi:MAG: hypothetical protein A2Y79_00430 [Deltaproteobacteria bacterium RBG_13_43_22]|nr:MAG: hypothetical protein A2Y79_00430 [Deltaproteobacteria bacterium RBG_13_43_22]